MLHRLTVYLKLELNIINGNYKIRTIILMFYVAHNLRTEVVLPHKDIQEMNMTSYIVKSLRKMIEGRCLKLYGFLIQILPMKGFQAKSGIKMGEIKVEEDGCVAYVYFDCLCFKPMKGDVFDVDIGIVSEELVRGKVGTAEVLIPRLKMEEVIFNDKLNEYTTELSNGETVKIASGERIRCRCVDWFTESENSMKIICSLETAVLESKIIGRY